MAGGRASPAKRGPSLVHETLLRPVPGLSFLIPGVKVGKDWSFPGPLCPWGHGVDIVRRRDGPQGRATLGPKLLLTAGGGGQDLMCVTCRRTGRESIKSCKDGGREEMARIWSFLGVYDSIYVSRPSRQTPENATETQGGISLSGHLQTIPLPPAHPFSKCLIPQ